MLVISLLACYGITFGLMNDKVKFLTDLFQALPVLRDEDGKNIFGRMLSCSYCTGFHAGGMV